MTRLVLLAFLVGLGACDKPAGEVSSGTGIPTAEAKGPDRTQAAAPRAGEPSADTVVASWEGGTLTYGELNKDLKSQLTKLEVDYLTQRYETQSSALQDMVLERLLEAEAKKRGLADANALLDQEIREKVQDPTEAEVEEFYPQVQRQLRNKPLEEVRDQVKGALRQRRERERFMTFVDELKSKAGLQVTLPMPDLPRMEVGVDDDPVRGNADAKVTIVQFADFQCPYCGRANETVQKVLQDYDGKVKMVFRDFPLGFHERAIPAAVAVNCAEPQGKYWEMFDQVMPNQRTLEDSDLEGYARNAKLDLGAWNKCRQDPAQAEEVKKDLDDGQALGVTGTPAFFINGIMISGAQPYEQFKAIIDRELAGG